jgi:hypothetical protein
MSNYVKLATEAGDQYLTFLAESQEKFLKVVSATPWAGATATVPAPAALDLPTPREVAEANFAFASKLLKQQKAFTEKLFTTTTSSN